ncbi:hypothetical protein ABZ570_29730 [Micromonospora sp. NPDC007271]|uniref:hypothetical protein n=1 Tax=Micromonospora sp. NPDC007271 TaxID=3154587 RepID=UPI0033C23BDC
MSGQLSANQRGHNVLAIAACCLGLGSLLFISVGMAGLLALPVRALIPLLLGTGCAVVLGAVGLKRIKANGQRGRGLAIAGCGAGAAGFLLVSVVVATLSSGL